MSRETRILPASDKHAISATTNDAGQHVLAGYGVVFDSLSEDLGGFREIIDPKAANRTLSLGNDFLVTMNHDMNLLLGRTGSGTARVHADDIGVAYEVDVPDTAAGRDAWTLAKRGDLPGSSFTFSVPESGAGVRWSRDGDTRIRRVLEFRLYELGPVASPAYLDTTVAARSLEAIRATEAANGADADTSDSSTVNIAARRLRFAR